MSLAEKLCKVAKDMHLEGEELQKWVEKQIQDEEDRKEREIQRRKEEKKEDDERRKEEEERRAREEERSAKEEERRQQEHERNKTEMENRRKLIEEETALLRLKAESAASDGATPNSSTTGSPFVKAPRLSPFDDRNDDIDSYLKRFQRYAEACKWKRSDWSMHLGALLRNKALDVYSRMDEEDVGDYDKLKVALLKRYNLTEWGFLKRFREARPLPDERAGQFKSRLMHYMEKYIELAGKDKNKAEDIKDLFLKEQLLNASSPALQVFLRERDPKTSDALVDFVEHYIDAHGASGTFSKRERKQEQRLESTQVKSQAHTSARGPTPSFNCRLCGKRGHTSNNCWRRGNQKIGAVETSAPPYCMFCDRRGHDESRCWEKKRQLKMGTGTPSNSEGGARNKTQVSAIQEIETKCDGHGHVEMKCGCKLPVLSALCQNGPTCSTQMPVASGKLNGKEVTVLRDSGCSCVVVKQSLVSKESLTGTHTAVRLADGKIMKAQVVQVHLDCPYFSGEVSAVTMETPLYDVILGNIAGAKCPGTPVSPPDVSSVETRASSQKKVKKLLTPEAVDTGLSVNDLIAHQKDDTSLDRVRELAATQEVKTSGKANMSWYGLENGVIMRYFSSPAIENGDTIKQVVVPTSLRNKVMTLGHENIMAGHLGSKKTTERILTNFYWPNIWQDVAMFCQSCDQCQRSTPRGVTSKVPLERMPLIDEPFSRIAIDLIGPIMPASERGHRYILTAVDYSTRFPEAVPLKSIDTPTVAEALVDIFSRTGIAREILHDRGTQFTSELMAEVCRLLSVKQLVTSPYHPQCNGLVERFNSTLKSMLKKLASERPRDWDRYISAALFAYREAPQESLGFSPFELVFGRTVRGPMTILRELWTKDLDDGEVKTTYQYVLDLKNKMEETIQLAKENLQSAAGRYKSHFDRKARPRKFKVGDLVLLLLPTKHNKLELKWQGPFAVQTEKGHNNYSIQVENQTRTYHANMLKAYHVRKETEELGVLHCATAAIIEEEENDVEDQDQHQGRMHVETPSLMQTENMENVEVNKKLDPAKQSQLLEIFAEFQDILTDVPGTTNLMEHKINLTSSEPVRKKPYPVPQALREVMKEEVDSMIKAGIIEPSNSAYCSPSVVVKKKDGSNRYCIDFRALNNISKFDAEPMPRMDDIFQEIGTDSKFLTKIDLSKGYWQIPLSDAAKPLTAFATEKGLYQFKVMPFGLQNAPATFSRLMRKVLNGARHVNNYLDDVVLHTESWEEHLEGLRDIFTRLRKAGLTARPSKCLVGFDEIELLGHMVGNGQMKPTIDKVEAIREAKPPQSKKEMRSFLGLASFYKRYVPNFSAIASPLTDATRRGQPNSISWDEPKRRAFQKLKEALVSDPVIRLPDFNQTFSLKTDASDRGLGAILMQEHNGENFPVVYLSRKLKPCEERYSVVEKECLAIAWAVKSLHSYLYGREFQIETDHAPLLYLNKAKSENGRLMRWALLLNQYRFNIKSVPGKDNHGPDFLSRAH